jgi:hypothetical protein
MLLSLARGAISWATVLLKLVVVVLLWVPDMVSVHHPALL